MTEPNYTISLNAKLAGVNGEAAIGDLLIPDATDPSSGYVVASAANRGSRRAEGVAISSWQPPVPARGSVRMQSTGTVDADISGLGVGTKTLVKSSADGRFERVVTYGAGDDIVGLCEANGRVHLCFGFPAEELVPPVFEVDITGDFGVQVLEPLPNVFQVRGIAGTCTLEQFGAVGDGTTDDQEAFEAAIAALVAGTYSTIVLGAGKSYLIEGTGDVMVFPFGCHIVGYVFTSIIKTSSNRSVLLLRDTDASDRNKYTSFTNFRIEGNSAGGSQIGLEIGYIGNDGSDRVRIIGCEFRSLGRGVSLTSPNSTASAARIVACRFDSCTYGVYAVMPLVLTSSTFNSCTTGINIATGNVNVTGCAFVECTLGAHVVAGGNDSHGTFSSCQFLHNTTALRFGAIANGHSVADCLIYQGAIVFDGGNAGAVSFVGGIVDATTYTLVGRSRWIGVTFDQAYFSSVSTTSGQNEFIDCRDIDGSIPTWIGQRQRLAYTFGSDANATLSSQDSWAQTIAIASGVISATRTLTMGTRPPNRAQRVLVKNGNAQDVAIQWASGSSVTVPAGQSAIVGADGTNAVLELVTSAGGSTDCDEPAETHQVEHRWEDGDCTESPGCPNVSVVSYRVELDTVDDDPHVLFSLTGLPIPPTDSVRDQYQVDVVLGGGVISSSSGYQGRATYLFDVFNSGTYLDISTPGGSTIEDLRGSPSTIFALETTGDPSFQITITPDDDEDGKWFAVVQVTRFANVPDPGA